MADEAQRAQNPDPAQQLFQIAGGYILSTALYVVADAGVADHLGGGPRHCSDLADATHTHEDALYRTLRLLASVGVFEEVAPRTFALTPSAELLQRNHPHSVRDTVLFLPDALHLKVYAEFSETLRTGRPAGETALGGPVFEYFRKNPAYSEVFNRAMTNLSAAIVPAAIEAFDFGGIGVLVDVAGGHGQLLVSVLNAHPAMHGVLMDLDHVIDGAKPYLAAARLDGRIRAVAGDFFTAVPAGGDAYIMKHIIHDWDDERAAVILQNVRTAMGTTAGRLLLLEGVVPAGNEPHMSKLMDLEMMALPGGRERTADEFQALFARAGFELVSITPTKSPVSVIEGRPRTSR